MIAVVSFAAGVKSTAVIVLLCAGGFVPVWWSERRRTHR